MTVIGLTGPTGAGKSVIARRFEQAGAFIIDADKLAREVTEKGHPCLLALAAYFGNDILNDDGTLDRAALAYKAFATSETRQALNDITHPQIIARSEELLSACTAPVAVIDAPLLFESGMDRLCDRTIAVIAPLAVRKARIMARDGITGDQADRRIAAQKTDDYYVSRATDCLVNDRDADHTAALADRIIKEVM